MGGFGEYGDPGADSGFYILRTFMDDQTFARRDWDERGTWERITDWWKPDSDGDGVPDEDDRLPGRDDHNTPGVLTQDGRTIMVNNGNGTWSAYRDGIDMEHDWRLTSIADQSGTRTVSGGIPSGGSIAATTGSTTYTWTRN